MAGCSASQSCLTALPGTARPILACRRSPSPLPAPVGTDAGSLVCATKRRRRSGREDGRIEKSSLRHLHPGVHRPRPRTAGAAVYAPAMIACNLALEPLTYAGTVAAIVAFTILLLAITNLLMLNVRDIFAALVVAFAPFMAAMLPAARLRAPAN